MKKNLFLLVLLCSQLAVSQIALEHSYSQNMVTRIQLEHFGEKYYVADKTVGNLLIFNADHTLWKTIDLMISDPQENIEIANISSRLLNNDDALEVVYSFFSEADQSRKCQIITETGAILFSVPNVSGVFMSEFPGLPSKILLYSNLGNETSVAVYDTNLTLQHTFDAYTKRIALENSGEKYYTVDRENEQIKLFNSDFTPWKTLSLPKPDGSAITTIYFVSETTVNPDAQLEIGYDCYRGTAVTSRIVNESGNILLSADNLARLEFSKIEGLPTKLVTTGILHDGSGQVTSVFSLPSLTLEHHYTECVKRIKFGESGEKYYTELPTNNIAKIYNADHTLWRTIPLPVSEGLGVIWVKHVSQTRINSDENFEIAYTMTSTTDVPQQRGRIINDTGNLILDMRDVFDFSLNEIPGLDDKFIGIAWTNGDFQGNVYGFGTLQTTNFTELKKIIYPNPASSEVLVRSETSINTISVYNSNGQLVAVYDGPEITRFSVSDLSQGLYLLRLSDILGKVTTHKILISR